MIRRGYTDTPNGQWHWRRHDGLGDAPGGGAAPDLYCFHPAPFSGLAFTTIIPYLAQKRRVIAPDYPGYGGSDAPTAPASIERYARAMLDVIDEQSGAASVDVLGFHSGCLVAAELCIVRSEQVRKAVLIDVPAFDRQMRATLKTKNARPLELTPALSCLEGPWESGITKRLPSQPMSRAFEMFVEQIRPGAAMNEAFGAAFSYEWAQKFPEIKTQTLVLATQSPLLEGSRQAAEMIEGAQLVERLDIKRAVLDEAAEATAGEVVKFLA